MTAAGPASLRPGGLPSFRLPLTTRPPPAGSMPGLGNGSRQGGRGGGAAGEPAGLPNVSPTLLQGNPQDAQQHALSCRPGDPAGRRPSPPARDGGRQMNRTFSLLACASLVALTATAAVARDNQWYIGLRGGIVLPTDGRFRSQGGTQPEFDTTEHSGWAAAARLGYDFGLLRTEVDLGYQQNRLRSIDLLSSTTETHPGRYANPTGRIREWTLMANALLDLINGEGFSASVGAGAGAARINAHNLRLSPGDALLLNESRVVFAWNALAGARVALGPGVDLAVDYRYLHPSRVRFGDGSNTRFSTQNASHTILVGFNFNLGSAPAVPAPEPAPAPAPPPLAAAAPAPAPAAVMEPMPPPPPMQQPAAMPVPGPLLLFFDFDQSAVTAEGRLVVAEAARLARRTGSATLGVGGHADRAGSQGYNQALGERRGRAVQQLLEAMGVERSRISIRSEGEDAPRVDTADGQREPQNRRVEIIIQPGQ